MNVTTVPPAIRPGDYHQDGTIEAADYTDWCNNLGSGVSLPNDDTAGVGEDDYDRWKKHYGNMAGSGSVASGAVPEPNTLAMLIAMPLVMLSCRRPAVA